MGRIKGIEKVPENYWAAVVSDRVIVWAPNREELDKIMSEKGYERDQYKVIRVKHDRDELLDLFILKNMILSDTFRF
jgi:hypothetical protein